MHLNCKYPGTLVCYGNRGTYQPTIKMRLFRNLLVGQQVPFSNQDANTSLPKRLSQLSYLVISRIRNSVIFLVAQYVPRSLQHGKYSCNSTVKINFFGEYSLTNRKVTKEYFKTVLSFTKNEMKMSTYLHVYFLHCNLSFSDL